MKISTITLLIIFIGHARITNLEELHGPLFLPNGQIALGGEFGHIHLIVDLKRIAQQYKEDMVEMKQAFYNYTSHMDYSGPEKLIAGDLFHQSKWIEQQFDLMEHLFGLSDDKTKRQILAALGAIFGLAAGGLSIFCRWLSQREGEQA